MSNEMSNEMSNGTCGPDEAGWRGRTGSPQHLEQRVERPLASPAGSRG